MSKILCIDDNRLNLRIVKKLLSRIGLEVLQSETGGVGLQIAKMTQPELILVNINLPDMNGLELARRIKADHELADVAIIAMIPASMRQEKDYILEVACSDVLVKPIIPQDLYTVIRNNMPEGLENVVWFSEA
jgi:CheY-like chemotaxis protein